MSGWDSYKCCECDTYMPLTDAHPSEVFACIRRGWTLFTDDPQIWTCPACSEKLRNQRQTDIALVAGFIAGYWPILEDGIDWGQSPSYYDDHPILAAAKRLLEDK